VLTLIACSAVPAANQCFSLPAVASLVEASEDLDQCFQSDVNHCGYRSKSIDTQKEINALRLHPIDRIEDSLLDNAVGKILARFGDKHGPLAGKTFSASAVKVSRCHILTSAHLIYREDIVPFDGTEDVSLLFLTGQTCQPGDPFSNASPVRIIFNMMAGGFDRACWNKENELKCGREISGDHDIVIAKLERGHYDPHNRNFFELDIENLSNRAVDTKVNCYGFPAHNEQLSHRGIDKVLSEQLLWGQRNATMVAHGNIKFKKGTPTTAISYKGMSGGACVHASAPRLLAGIYANGNSGSGHPAIYISPEAVFQREANYLSPLHLLADRFKRERIAGGHRVTDIRQLDQECD